MTKKAEKDYRRWVALEHECLACGLEDDTRVAHHLTFIKFESSMGGKASDNYLVPLCYICHIERLHRHGEKIFWLDRGFTLDQVVGIALELHMEYNFEVIK